MRFDVDGETFAIPERSATVFAEKLRRKAAGQLGIEGLALEAADCVLNVSMHWAMSNPTAYPRDVAFFQAIIELHKQQAGVTRAVTPASASVAICSRSGHP